MVPASTTPTAEEPPPSGALSLLLPLLATIVALWISWGDGHAARTLLTLDANLGIKADARLLAAPLALDRLVIAAQGLAPELRILAVSPRTEVSVLHRMSMLGRVKVTKGRQPLAMVADERAIFVVTDSWTLLKLDFKLGLEWQSELHSREDDTAGGEGSATHQSSTLAAPPVSAMTCSNTLVVLASDGSVVAVDASRGRPLWSAAKLTVASRDPVAAQGVRVLEAESSVDIMHNQVRYEVECRTGRVLRSAREPPGGCPKVASHRVPFPAVSVFLSAYEGGDDRLTRCLRVRVQALGGFERFLGSLECSNATYSVEGVYAWASLPKPTPGVFAKGMPSAQPWQDVEPALFVVNGAGQVFRLGTTGSGNVRWSVESTVNSPRALSVTPDGIVVVGARRLVFITMEGRVTSHLDLPQEIAPCPNLVDWAYHKVVVELASGDLAQVSLQRGSSIALPSLMFLPVAVLLIACWALGCLISMDTY